MPISITIDTDNVLTALSEMEDFLAGRRSSLITKDDRQAEMFPKVVSPATGYTDNLEVVVGEAEKPKRGRKPKLVGAAGDVVGQGVEKPSISTGDERIDMQTTAEDKTDTTGNPNDLIPGPVKIENRLLTLDDVRSAAKGYIDKFGMPAASADLAPCLMAVAGVPAISQLGDADQATLQKAVEAFMAAGAAATRYGQAA